MADKEKKQNIFRRIGKLFKNVKTELKRVVWPSKEKLKTTSAVVLVVIVFFAILLTVISQGGSWILDKVGFYEQVETTVATESTGATTAATESTASESQAEETTETNSSEES